jgi:hypothetical protein
MRSYGCDSTVLAMLPSDPVLQQEASDLQNFMTATRTFSETFYNLVTQTLQNLPRTAGMTYAPAYPAAPHETRSGCLRPTLPPQTGTPSNSPEAEDFSSLMESIFLAVPDYFAKANFNASSGSYDPVDEKRLPVGILFRNTFDQFQTGPNTVILDRAFVQRKEDIGRDRPLPLDITSLTGDSFFFQNQTQRQLPRVSQDVSGNTEQEMGILEAEDRDAMSHNRDTLQAFTDAVDGLVKIVKLEDSGTSGTSSSAGFESFLPKKYIPELAYFLLRSCVDGPCQTTLDTVMQRTYNPYCHPYVNSKFTEEDAQKKCYCDSEVQGLDSSFWDKYCSTDYSTEQSRYDSMEQKADPACQIESSSSTGP